jgi:hypothetical protein
MAPADPAMGDLGAQVMTDLTYVCIPAGAMDVFRVRNAHMDFPLALRTVYQL